MIFAFFFQKKLSAKWRKEEKTYYKTSLSNNIQDPITYYIGPKKETVWIYLHRYTPFIIYFQKLKNY